MLAAERIPPLDPDAEDTQRLGRRMRIAVALCIAPIILFALFDLALLPPAELPLFWAIKLGALLVIVVAAWQLRVRPGQPPSRGRLIVIGLCCVAAMYALSTASAVLAREGQTTIVLSMAVALATATLLPWGVGPQLVVVGIAGLSTIVSLYGANGDLHALVQYPTVGLVIGLCVSVYLAGEFARGRQALVERQQERRRAEDEVRLLNARLEARVAERTAELRQSQAAVSALIENAADAIWAIDRDGRLLISNAAVRRRYAAQVGRELGSQQDHPAVVRQAIVDYWAPRYARGLAGERFRDEQAIEGLNGTRYYVNAFNPIVIDGEVAGLAVFSSDVTELRQSAAAARQRQEELTHVQRLSTLGELAAGLAHEINQPLAAIVNYARGSARRLRDDPDTAAAVLPAIDSIASEAMRAGEVIRRLRRLIRKGAPRQEWVDVNALVDEAVRMVEPDARQRAVRVEVFLASILPPLLGDGIQIEQVVINLLRNAIEAMTAGGDRRVLQVTTRRSDGGGIELAVRDTGPGLPTGMAETIFDPFISTKSGGLGMGLSISRTIVEAHQGRLWASANPDGGMTFRVELPTSVAASGEADDESSEPLRASR
jgi:signal transduction histidine kinase